MKIKHSYEPSVDFFSQFEKKLFVQRWITEVTLHHVFEKLQRIQLAATKSILQKYIHTLDKIFSFFK